jgi:MoxR-like ATPase
MQEHQVTIGKETHPVEQPFIVLATQNPIEADGTYPLPEAQIDRFMLKVLVDYPTYHEEIVVVERMIGAQIAVRQVIDLPQLIEMQEAVREVYVDPVLMAYAATLSSATRKPAETGLEEFARAIAFGASPRASIHLIQAARALAYIRGRDYVLGHDVSDVAPEVLRHRIVLTYDGIADEVSTEAIVSRLLQKYPAPRLDLADDVAS